MDSRLPVYIIAIGILILTLLFILAKRQIMRFAQRFPTDGPHAPIGYDAPKKLTQEIERRLNVVKEIRMEPVLMNVHNPLATEENIATYKHINRMKAIDSLKTLEETIERNYGLRRLPPSDDLRVFLLNLRKENMPLHGCESKLINQFVECYASARSGTDEFDIDHYMSLLGDIEANLAAAPVHTRNVSKANSPLNLNKRKTSKNSASGSNQTVTLKSVSPTKFSAFQTQIVQQDDRKGKDNETCV